MAAKTKTPAIKNTLAKALEEMGQGAPAAPAAANVEKDQPKLSAKAREFLQHIKDEAAQDAATIVNAQDQKRTADMSIRMIVLERANELRDPKAHVPKETGIHEKHALYLETFESAMRQARNEGEKASAYTRRLKSDIKVIFAAVQIATADVTIKGKDKDGKAVETVVKDASVSEYLGTMRDLNAAVSASRAVCKQAGVAQRKSDGGVRPIKSTSLSTILGKLHGRLTVQMLPMVLDWLISEARTHVMPGNVKFYDGQMGNAKADFMRALSERVEPGRRTRSNAKARAAAGGNVHKLKAA